ncbi:MAG: choice-of-anchor D domain-containing protein [Limisphaerales bacterium]
MPALPGWAAEGGGTNTTSIRVFGGQFEVFNQSSVPTPINNTDFGRVNLANRVGFADFIITNVGSSSVFVQAVDIQGSHAADYSLRSFQPTHLAPGGFKIFGIDFDPSGAGLRSALVSIANTDPAANPFQFAIQGEGEQAPVMKIRAADLLAITNGSPASADQGTELGSVNIRGGSERRTFTIGNEGSAALDITGVSVSGPWAPDFSLPDFSPRMVGVGGSMQFDLVFDPSALGDRWATLWITNNAENLFRFDVHGVGIGFPHISVLDVAGVIPTGSTNSSSMNGTDFGDVPLDGAFGFRTFTITNSGDDVLSVFAPSATGTNAADFVVTQFPASSVAVGGSTSFSILFSPGGKGLRMAELRIPNGDQSKNPYVFRISGRGLRVPIPQRLQVPRLIPGRVQLRFGDLNGQAMTAEEASRMELQHSPNLQSGSWIPVPNSAVLEGGLILIEDAPDPASHRRFYRVIER